ncbi:MAG: hypothetical protein A3J74_07405 [Elusimicrobia bacterium RIFCSPHIGHO2_02_FULL_57_9]|nr:MAG: hypothetical protein A3J74_07405 [Elusimicrobia bacterium RIFCSPHIGHO2_02_FULL_57_9]
MRHRVVLRPKVRGQKIRQQAAIAALLMLGVGAAATLRHFDWGALSSRRPKIDVAPPFWSFEVQGVPKELRDIVLAFLNDRPRLSPAQTVQELGRRFPCLETINFNRPWFKETLRFDLSMRRALGQVQINRKPAGFLSDNGVIFSSPAGFYTGVLPVLETGQADSAELKALAGFLSAAARPGALLSPLESMRFISSEDGWEAALADGTRAQWGQLAWTREKLERLREVLIKARSEFDGGVTADLRYFEDGRILLRPLAPPRPAGRR